MLIPLRHDGAVVGDGAFVGFIAVHSAAEVRDWSPQDIAALERAQRQAEQELSRAPWFEVRVAVRER